MDSKPYTWAITLILGALIISGCGTTTTEPTTELTNPASVYCEEQGYTLEGRTGANGGTYRVCTFPDGSECEEWAFYRGECKPASSSETAVDTPEAGPPAEEMPTKAPAPVPTQAVAEMRDVVYEGISLRSDHAIAADVAAGAVPATDEEGPGWTIEPAHVRFSLNGYVLPDTFHEPRIEVYPVTEFEAISEHAAKTIADLRQLLVDRPVAPETIPFLPPFNAGQMMCAQVAYIDFQNGTGVRFLTHYAQAYVPVNNHELFYTFQGLTDDGSAYVAAILPVSHPALPSNQMAYEGNLDTLAQNFDTYIADIKEQLNAQDAPSFTPDLSLLDAMIQSLEVVPTWTTAVPSPTAQDTLSEIELEAILEIPATLPSGEEVNLRFTLINSMDTKLYVLKWYTPLEGLTGEIFTVKRDGEVIPYEGILAYRVTPSSEAYISLDAGESVSAEIDLAAAYDFTKAGEYTIEFISPRISHVARTESEMAETLEDLGPVRMPSNKVTVNIERSSAPRQSSLPEGEGLAPSPGQTFPLASPGVPHTITVVGTGKVSLVPDVARINVGAEVLADTVSEAKAEIDHRMAAIIAALEEAGVGERDIQTSHYSIHFTTACVTCKTGATAAVLSALVMVWAVLAVILFKPATLASADKQVA